MKYQNKKFSIRKQELLSSKIFDLHKSEFSYGFGNNVQNSTDQSDSEWKKKLKFKENILTLHFKQVLSNYKPRILMNSDPQTVESK
mmetsp:Transcript_23821/g.20755  ORF Transcript_23821/g.20755 Transcript_23821/m.20755 type:complete len:86 (+) Transcript_23821:982-1239(+)